MQKRVSFSTTGGRGVTLRAHQQAPQILKKRKKKLHKKN